MKQWVILLLAVVCGLPCLPQHCDCESNLAWVKKTFEENDAGFQLILNRKGQAEYNTHNQLIMERIKAVKDSHECMQVINDWLHFFRKGHIGFMMTHDTEKTPETGLNWETFPVDIPAFKKYLESKQISDYEGIFGDNENAYTIGVKKAGDEYVGFIIESIYPNWKPNDVKFRIIPGDGDIKSVYYMRDKSKTEGNNAVELWKNSILKISSAAFKRLFPVVLGYEDYYKRAYATEPFLEKLDENTLYFRVPSFMGMWQKQLIDSVLSVNKNKILNTANLIIDIRNNGGGGDEVYEEIIPFLYTNPIRKVAVEFLSTKTSNQQYLDFSVDTVYGLSENQKTFFKNGYEYLEKHLGEFINPWKNKTWTTEFPVVHRYPKNVGIIINGGVASAAEEFLMEAKQSFKVKLFGTPSMGALDVSNIMINLKSPCKDFVFYYATSRSLRLPDLSVDDIGIQPDFLIDSEIPDYQWVDYVKIILDLNK